MSDRASSPHRRRAAVPPVPAGTARPRWSVMIPTYHCADYLAHTLRSVLRQDPGPDAMQIEVVDDRSERDDPERVVRDVGGGRVSFFRQPQNVGHVRNFNTCLQRSRGRRARASASTVRSFRPTGRTRLRASLPWTRP